MKTFKDLFKNKKILVISILLFVLILTGIFTWSNLKTDKEVDYRNYVTGLRNWTVEVDTKEVDYLSGVSWNKDEIKKVTVDSKAVDLTKEGNYDLTYTIDVIKKDVKDIQVEKKVKVVSKEEAKEEADKGEEVATQDGIQNKKSEEDLKKEEESKKKETSNNTNQQSSSNRNTAKVDSDRKNSSSSNSKPSSNSSSKPASNSGSNKPSNSNKEDKPVHKHNWEQQYKPVYHDEVSHEEEYVIKAAWTEIVPEYKTEIHTFCNCGVDLTELERNGGSAFDHGEAHALKHESDQRSGKPIQIQVGTTTINHPAEMGKRKVVDKEAYTEQVPDGYKCSECGARK